MNNDLKKRMIMEDINVEDLNKRSNMFLRDKEEVQPRDILEDNDLNGIDSIKEEFAFEKAEEVVPLIQEYICSGFDEEKNVMIHYPHNHWEFLDDNINKIDERILDFKYWLLYLKIARDKVMKYLTWLIIFTPIITLSAYLFENTYPLYIIAYGLLFCLIYEFKICSRHSYILNNPKEVFLQSVDKSNYSISEEKFDRMLAISWAILILSTLFIILLMLYMWVCGEFSMRKVYWECFNEWNR